MHNQPTPPSGSSAPTYHWSPSSYNAARPSYQQPTLQRVTSCRPRPPQHLRGHRPDLSYNRPIWNTSDRANNPTTLAAQDHGQAMLSCIPTSWSRGCIAARDHQLHAEFRCRYPVIHYYNGRKIPPDVHNDASNTSAEKPTSDVRKTLLVARRFDATSTTPVMRRH